MKKQEQKRTLWFELFGGDLSRKVQVEYEKAVRYAKDKNVSVKFGCAIVIYPPEGVGTSEMAQFGKSTFEIAPATMPKYKSNAYTTQLDDEGFVVNTGESIADILQEELRFEELEGEKITKFKIERTGE